MKATNFFRKKSECNFQLEIWMKLSRRRVSFFPHKKLWVVEICICGAFADVDWVCKCRIVYVQKNQNFCTDKKLVSVRCLLRSHFSFRLFLWMVPKLVSMNVQKFLLKSISCVGKFSSFVIELKTIRIVVSIFVSSNLRSPNIADSDS